MNFYALAEYSVAKLIRFTNPTVVQYSNPVEPAAGGRRPAGGGRPAAECH